MYSTPLRYAITDRTLVSSDASERRAYLLRQAARLAASGIDFLQLREKDLPAAELAGLTRDLLPLLRHSPTRLLLNHRADIAVATAAHGVHLTSAAGELTPRQVRTLYRRAGLPDPIVTLSCHTLDDIRRHADSSGLIDAILFGPVFEKSVSGQYLTTGTGLALLAAACVAADPIPVLALGGVTPATVDSCHQAGARGIAGIRPFLNP